MANREKQAQAILRVLREAAPGWVPLPKIINALGEGAVIAQYNARIFELRKDHNIPNKWKHIDSQRHSWYRLVVDGEMFQEDPC